MYPVVEFAALFVIFVTCLVAVGVAADLVNSGRAGRRLKEFRWGRFFLRLWLLATIAWMYALIWLGDSWDSTSLMSAVVLRSGFAFVFGIALRRVTIGPAARPATKLD
jgi:hypothetical protein